MNCFKIFKKNFFSFIVFSSGLFSPAARAAIWNEQLSEIRQSGKIARLFPGSGSKELVPLIIDIIEFVLGFLGLISVIIIIIAGYRWMTAGGNEKNVEEAKHQLKAAVIGIIIILASWSLVHFVIDNFIGISEQQTL